MKDIKMKIIRRLGLLRYYPPIFIADSVKTFENITCNAFVVHFLFQATIVIPICRKEG